MKHLAQPAQALSRPSPGSARLQFRTPLLALGLILTAALTLTAALAVTTALALAQAAPRSASPAQQIWRFDRTASLDTHPQILGHPNLIDTPAGKAIAFNGVDDALFFTVHPLAGAAQWTWEMIFRPDPDGKPEQRIFHLQSVDPATGADIPDERMLFEIRIRNGQWCLDSFASSSSAAGPQSRALLNCEKLYPFGPWYRVTAVYDGSTLRNYVNDQLQGEGELHMTPPRPGRASLGTRINLRDYYKGAVYAARFTPRALPVQDFLQLPPGL